MTTSKEYRKFAKEMIDYTANYLDTIRERPVIPKVKPGYMKDLIPQAAPYDPDDWRDVMKDIEKVIMPGVTHWNSPQFHAYFPTAQSYPAIVADILSDAISCIGFSWIASPACTELEMVTMDWLGKMLGLPEEFLFSGPGNGGGVIQGTASEATLGALLAARTKACDKYIAEHPEEGLGKTDVIPKLVAYASRESHSSAERAGLLGGVKIRLLDTDDKYSMRGETLAKAIEEDKAKGLIPFYCVATLGTTSTCAFDDVEEIGPICNENDVWLHIDAAYAGTAFILPECRHLMRGVERADSFCMNPHKWMLVTFDCSAFFVKDQTQLEESFNVDPLYLKHNHQGEIPDYRHWHIPLGRRFRSLKLWFVLRLYGVKGLQEHVRKHIALAKEFEQLVLSDNRFEVVNEVLTGLVCYRLKTSNETNEKLNAKINENGKIHMSPSKSNGLYYLRFVVCSRFTESRDVQFAWDETLACLKDLYIEDNDLPVKYQSREMFESVDYVINSSDNGYSSDGVSTSPDGSPKSRHGKTMGWLYKKWPSLKNLRI